MKTFEYETIKINENSDFCECLNNFSENEKETFLDNLIKYLKKQKLTEALKRGHKEIYTQNYVGIIKYKNFQLDILPKMLKRNDKRDDEYHSVMQNLSFMLSYTKKLDIKTTNYGKSDSSKNPFLEILIREFAQSLFDCLKRITPKRYVREEDNLNYMKGKLKFGENIKYNCTNQAKFYCEYDEFSENNELNQLFLFVSTCLYSVSCDSKNKKLLKHITNYFCDINFVRFDKFMAEKISLPKNQEMFKRPFNLAKMFIRHSSVDLSKNKIENITLLWDMNILFEEFIYEVIKRHTKFTPYYQKGKRLLIETENAKKYGNTFTDMYIEKDGEKYIIDTKYKLNSAESNDFDNKDIYQLSTYCLINNSKNAIFIYPLENENIKEHNFNKYYLNTENADKICKNKSNIKNENNIYKIFSIQLNLKTDLRANLKSAEKEQNIAKYIENILCPILTGEHDTIILAGDSPDHE